MPRKIIRRRPVVAEVESVEPMHAAAKKPSHRWLIPVVIVAGLATTGIAAWNYLPASTRVASGPSATASVADLVKQVSKHVLVNSSENPMIATVQDPDSLRSQNPVFYKDAQQGDKLLVWSDKAVLFSPTRNVVVAMLAMSAFKAEAAPAPAPVATPAAANTVAKDEVFIEVRNGSATAGLARKTADTLKSDGWKIVTIADAKVKPVPKTEIFVSSKKQLGTLPASLAASLHGTIVKTVGDEPASTADILVIIGNDAQ